MNAMQTYRVALLLLAMLVSHEGITVAHNIRQAQTLRDNAELHESLKHMTALMELGELGSSSFLETENRQGMSVEAYATLEMKAIHKSLKEGFGFEKSPILEDLKTLPSIPSDRVLTEAELRSHRATVSSLLEKAMTGMHTHIASHAGQSAKSGGGNCVKTVAWHSTCSKASECRSDPKNPCKGDCVCDTSGINECACKTPDTGSVLHKSNEINKAFGVTDAIGPALFGFVDGFFSGMAGQFREAFQNPMCQIGKSDVSTQLRNVLHRLKNMWFVMKSIHKKVWTSNGRKAVISAIKALLQSIVDLLKRGLKFLWECPATKMLVVMVGVIAVMLLLNVAMMAAGFVVIPLIIKYVGMIMGLFYSFNYMKGKVIRLYKSVKTIMANRCGTTCKKGVVEDSFAMVGAILEIVVMSGLNEVIEFKVDKNAKSIFKRFGIGWHDTFKSDMRTLANAAKRAKEGKGLAAKLGFKSNADDVVPGGAAAKNDYKAMKSADDLKAYRRNVQSKLDSQVSRSSVEKELRQAYIQRQDDLARQMGKKPQYMKMEKWQKRNADLIGTTVTQRKMDLLETMIKGKKKEVESLFPKKTIQKMEDLLSTPEIHFEKNLDKVLHASSSNPRQLKREVDYITAASEINVLESLKSKNAVRKYKIKTDAASRAVKHGQHQYSNMPPHALNDIQSTTARKAMSTRIAKGKLGTTNNKLQKATVSYQTSLTNLASIARPMEDGLRWSKFLISFLLPYTKFTIDHRICNNPKTCPFKMVNTLTIGKDVNDGNLCNVLQREYYDAVRICSTETIFTEKLETSLLQVGAESPGSFAGVKGVCNRKNAVHVFQGMDRDVRGEISFDCVTNTNLCECLVWVGAKGATVVFTEGEEKLTLTGEGGGVEYRYEGSNRRRRLLQGGASGES